jgi:Fic family protein
MPHWDADSKELFENIQRVVTALHRAAVARAPLDVEVARQWHRELMRGLTIPEGEQWRGAFRGEPGCYRQVRIGLHFGTPPMVVPR